MSQPRPPGIAAAVRRAKRRERERCAKLAETYYSDRGWHPYYRGAGVTIAAEIRELGDKDEKRRSVARS